MIITCLIKNSLSELIEKIGTCKPYFIRCIKPNSKQDTTFVDSFVIKQLRYCSIIYLCKIRKSGFPYRIQFDDFLKWFEIFFLVLFFSFFFFYLIQSNSNSMILKLNKVQADRDLQSRKVMH